MAKPLCITEKHKLKFAESSYLQFQLERNRVEIIYFDEFSINDRLNNVRGWSEKGQKAYCTLGDDAFKMTFIVGFSKSNFYGVVGSNRAIDSMGVIHQGSARSI